MRLWDWLCRRRRDLQAIEDSAVPPVPPPLATTSKPPAGNAANSGGEPDADEERSAWLPIEWPTGPYRDSRDHLWDELLRVDLLIRAQAQRWLDTVAVAHDGDLWSMYYVSRTEVDDYLTANFVPPTAVTDALAAGDHSWVAAGRAARRAIDARLRETRLSTPLRLVRLVERFKLSPTERDIVLLCFLPASDARYRRLFGFLQDDPSRTQPTLELIEQILQPLVGDTAAGDSDAERYQHVRRAFASDAPLIANHLLVITSQSHADEPLALRAVRLDDRVAAYLLESDAVDERLVRCVTFPDQPALSWTELFATDDELARWRGLAVRWQQELGSGTILMLHGPPGAGQLKVARAICTATWLPLLVVDTAAALQSADGWVATADLCYREAALHGAAVYWTACEQLLEHSQMEQHWQMLIAAAGRFRGGTFLESQLAWDPAAPLPSASFRQLDFRVPGYELRLRIWRAALTTVPLAEAVTDHEALAAELANGFQFTEGQIGAAISTAQGIATLRDSYFPRLTRDDLFEGCRRQSGRRLMTFTRRVDVRTDLTEDDLILPIANKRQLVELQRRIEYHHRVHSLMGFDQRLLLGKGLIALFTGGPGTGKTMAAELLAHNCSLDLYKVDLSAVVSKWVGETEKNLSRVFGEAADANAIIFFDEADALFGKRGEVKDAQDRWANMEVNYLQQRIEEYSGVVILATNLRQNIDEAFVRRIQVLVEFPFPSEEARFAILRSLFPTQVRRPADDELRELASCFKLSGGNFKNIVLDAAFRAQDEATTTGAPVAITLRHLVAGTAREYQKLGKPITKGDFRDPFYSWVREDILFDNG